MYLVSVASREFAYACITWNMGRGHIYYLLLYRVRYVDHWICSVMCDSGLSRHDTPSSLYYAAFTIFNGRKKLVHPTRGSNQPVGPSDPQVHSTRGSIRLQVHPTPGPFNPRSIRPQGPSDPHARSIRPPGPSDPQARSIRPPYKVHPTSNQGPSDPHARSIRPPMQGPSDPQARSIRPPSKVHPTPIQGSSDPQARSIRPPSKVHPTPKQGPSDPQARSIRPPSKVHSTRGSDRPASPSDSLTALTWRDNFRNANF